MPSSPRQRDGPAAAAQPAGRFQAPAAAIPPRAYPTLPPPLSFRDPADEARFLASFARDQLYSDTETLTYGLASNCLYLLFLSSALLWQRSAAALVSTLTLLVQNVAVGINLYLLRRRTSTYLKWRSWLLAGPVLWIIALALPQQRVFYARACHTLPVYWVREVSFMMIPWMGLAPLAQPLPLKYGVRLQAVIVGVLLASSGWRRRVSFDLCELGPRRYIAAAEWVRTAAAAAADVALMVPRMEGAAAFHLVDTYMQLAVTFCGTLLLMHRSEWPQRARYARQQGLSAEAAALERWGRHGWQPLSLALLFVFGLPCVAMCAVHLGALLQLDF